MLLRFSPTNGGTAVCFQITDCAYHPRKQVMYDSADSSKQKISTIRCRTRDQTRMRFSKGFLWLQRGSLCHKATSLFLCWGAVRISQNTLLSGNEKRAELSSCNFEQESDCCRSNELQERKNTPNFVHEIYSWTVKTNGTSGQPTSHASYRIRRASTKAERDVF